jgi:hypothetical protein
LRRSSACNSCDSGACSRCSYSSGGDDDGGGSDDDGGGSDDAGKSEQTHYSQQADLSQKGAVNVGVAVLAPFNDTGVPDV